MDAQEKDDAPRTDGKIGRIADQTRGLMEDVKTWIDLKLQLVEIQITERIEAVANRVAVGATLAVLAFLTLLFLLITAGLALGEWIGRPSLGFLAVSGILALITIVVYLARPQFVKMSGEQDKPIAVEAAEKAPRLPPAAGGSEKASVSQKEPAGSSSNSSSSSSSSGSSSSSSSGSSSSSSSSSSSTSSGPTPDASSTSSTSLS